MPPTEDYTLKTHDIIAIILMFCVTVFGALSYFINPKDAPGAKSITEALVQALLMVLSFKFGVHQATTPLPPPGGSTETETKTTVQTPPAPVPDKVS